MKLIHEGFRGMTNPAEDNACGNVNLSNHVWIPQAQYAVYSKTSTEFYVCHEDHVQTQFG